MSSTFARMSKRSSNEPILSTVFDETIHGYRIREGELCLAKIVDLPLPVPRSGRCKISTPEHLTNNGNPWATASGA